MAMMVKEWPASLKLLVPVLLVPFMSEVETTHRVELSSNVTNVEYLYSAHPVACLRDMTIASSDDPMNGVAGGRLCIGVRGHTNTVELSLHCCNAASIWSRMMSCLSVATLFVPAIIT